MAGILFPCADRVILTAAAQERATRPETIAELSGCAALITHSVGEALRMAAAATPQEAIFVTGSLFVAAEARAILVRE
jgi:folylpolyglutamate synthase/dihydropteroate synthase